MPSRTSFSSIPRPSKAKTFLSQFLGTGAVAETNVADGSITAPKLAFPNARILTSIGAQVKRDTNPGIVNDTFTEVSWESEDFDTDAIWVVGSAARLTFPFAGDWEVYAHVEFAADADGYRLVQFRKNGANLDQTRVIAASSGATLPTVVEARSIFRAVAANDYATCCVRHTAGAALDINSNSRFGARYLGA